MTTLANAIGADTLSLLTFWSVCLLGTLLVTLVDRWFMRGW